MRANELMEGQTYILESPHVGVATYRGRHTGQLTLEDGSKLVAHANYLKFEREVDGRLQVVLVENGAGVVEAEQTKVEREREQEAKRIRMEQATQAAHDFMQSLGFTQPADRVARLGENEYRLNVYGKEKVDEIELDDFTIGELKAVIRMVQRGTRRP